MKYKYIAWDFNGTILDDVYASLESVNDILSRRCRPKITIEDYYSYGSGTITNDGCKIKYWCGKLGDYKMFEPVKDTSIMD